MVEKSFVVADSEPSFDTLLGDFFKEQDLLERCLAKGRVRLVGDEDVLVDVCSESAYVAEGYISLKEFKQNGVEPPQEGDVIDIYVERLDGPDGHAVLSYEKARREGAWKTLEELYEKKEPVEGIIFDRVRGGFTVNVQGITAFLPGSQLDVRPIKDVAPLMNIPQKFQLIRMDRPRNNIVVSRRMVLEDSRSESRQDLIAKIQVGQVLKGVVKNIKDYGVFVDLGGADGLLHITDMSWKRLDHPRDLLTEDQEIEVKVIRFSQENAHISLSLKALESDPWEKIESRYQPGARVKGRVTSIHNYGAFVELEPGIEGLIHVSEMSWQKKPVSPRQVLSVNQEVEVEVLQVEPSRRRLSLGLKQCVKNPWNEIKAEYTTGQVIEGVIKDVRDFGLFVEVVPGVDGIVHLSDLSWNTEGSEAIKTYTKGDKIKVKVLRIDLEKEQVALGVKQLESNPEAEKYKDFKKGEVVTCEVSEVQNTGIVVVFGDPQVTGFIRKGDLSRDRDEQKMSRFAIGEKLDAKIINMEGTRILLSIKARELEEERQIMSEYGSSDSGATLGEILGMQSGALLEKSVEDSLPQQDDAQKVSKQRTEVKSQKDAGDDVSQDS